MGLVTMHFATLYNIFHSSTYVDLNPTQAGEEERRLQFFKLFPFLMLFFLFLYSIICIHHNISTYIILTSS